MKTLVVALGLLSSCANALFFPKVKTVDVLNLKKYDGRWYEMYNSLIQRQTFQKNSFCTTADYTLVNGEIKVVNSGRLGSPTGKLNEINGVAKVVDSKIPGAINVKFPVGPQSDRPNYLVVKLGPENKDGKYAYSVITAPLKSMVWVLARNPETFRKQYETEVLAYLKKNWYSFFWNKPRESYQGDDCLYPQ